MKDTKIEVFVGLVHWPVLNKRGLEVTTSVTNLDIHDIARSSRTFGCNNFFIVTPIKAQHELLKRILGYWEGDEGNEYNPDRHDALSFVRLVESIEEAALEVEKKTGQKPLVAVTSAKPSVIDGDVRELMRKAVVDRRPILLLFGTGWGLTASIMERADFRVGPISGAAEDGYNHLSVRSAVAIYLDRLRGGL